MSKEKKEYVDSTKSCGGESGINVAKFSPASKEEITSMFSKNLVDQCLRGGEDTSNKDPLALEKILEEDTKGLPTQQEIDEDPEKNRE